MRGYGPGGARSGSSHGGIAVTVVNSFFEGGPHGAAGRQLPIDPLWLSGIVAGLVGYLAGRSRRSAFIAGVGGVLLSDVYTLFTSPSPTMVGGAGVFDQVVIAGVLAVGLAEIVGETRERLGGGPDLDRDRPLALHQDEGTGEERVGGRKDEDLVKALYGRLLVLALLAAASTQSAGQENAIDVPPLPAGIGDEPPFRRIRGRSPRRGGTAHYAGSVPLAVGDTYIDRDNTVYEVVAWNKAAFASSRGKAEMPDVSGESPRRALGHFSSTCFAAGRSRRTKGKTRVSSASTTLTPRNRMSRRAARPSRRNGETSTR